MADTDTDPGGSAFCDQILATFVQRLRELDGLPGVAERIESEVLGSAKVTEAGLRDALFGRPTQ